MCYYFLDRQYCNIVPYVNILKLIVLVTSYFLFLFTKMLSTQKGDNTTGVYIMQVDHIISPPPSSRKIYFAPTRREIFGAVFFSLLSYFSQTPPPLFFIFFTVDPFIFPVPFPPPALPTIVFLHNIYP